MNKKIEAYRRKELLAYLKEEYTVLKSALQNQLDFKSMVGLAGIFSIIFKVVKKGSYEDYDMILQLLKKIKQILVTEIIPDDIKKMIDIEKSKLPSEMKDSLTDDLILSIIRKFNNPVFINVIDTLIAQFSDALNDN